MKIDLKNVSSKMLNEFLIIIGTIEALKILRVLREARLINVY